MQATRELGGANSTVIPILIRDPEMLIEAMLEAKAEVEAEAKFNRPSSRPKLKRPNRTLYFTMKN